MSKILIFIPTLNERDNIQELLERIHGAVPDAETLFIDGNSTDGTQTIIKQHLSENPKVHLLLIHDKPRGRGAADTAGFRYAVENNFDFMVQMDADLSHQPEHIPNLLNAAQDNDVIIGSRFIKGGQIIRRGLVRNLLSRCANFYIRLLLDIKIKDSTSGFRCFTKKALASLNLNKKFSPGPANLIEILYECDRNKLKIKEIPIIFINRQKGRSKLSAREVVESLKAVLSLRCAKAKS